MEMAATAHLTAVAPDNEKFTVRSAPARLPRRKPNAGYRSREHLTERKVKRLIEAAAPRLWVQVGQRRRRYQNDPSLSRPAAYGALHRAGADSLQELVSGLKTKTLSI